MDFLYNNYHQLFSQGFKSKVKPAFYVIYEYCLCLT
jgi:hypothetical protein